MQVHVLHATGVAGVLAAGLVVGPATVSARGTTPGVAPNRVTVASDSTGGALCTAPETRAFDFWIGEWDVLNRNRKPDGAQFYETGRATDKVHPVVGGCAIVEHWRGDAIGRYILGYSIRSYDSTAGEWKIVLLWPTSGQPSFGELTGGFRHGRGTFRFQRILANGDTALNRFIFSDIEPNALRWENGTSRDGGLSWLGNWIMEFTRRPPLASALLNGPTMTTERCPGKPYRRFDGALGEWEGTRTGPTGDTVPARTYLFRILEGCAVVERTWALDGSWESYRVRAWEPAAEQWVEYAIDSNTRTLVRRVADVTGDEFAFHHGSGSDADGRRIRWAPGPNGAPGWVVEEAERPGGPWRVRSVLHFERPLAAP
jgi:hypothetical protein